MYLLPMEIGSRLPDPVCTGQGFRPKDNLHDLTSIVMNAWQSDHAAQQHTPSYSNLLHCGSVNKLWQK